MRRIPIRVEWRNNPSAAEKIIAIAQDHFRASTTLEFARNMAACREPKLMLPPRNTPSKILLTEYLQIYNQKINELSNRLNKNVVAQRRGRSLKVVDLNFSPALNNPRHPIRRCTDTCSCDLKAAFRFGVAVSARYEFDVTADGGIGTKWFLKCDGSSHRITAKAKHLNMRINDDFREG